MSTIAQNCSVAIGTPIFFFLCQRPFLGKEGIAFAIETLGQRLNSFYPITGRSIHHHLHLLRLWLGLP